MRPATILGLFDDQSSSSSSSSSSTQLVLAPGRKALVIAILYLRFSLSAVHLLRPHLSPMLQLVQRSLSDKGLLSAGGRAVPLPGTDARIKLFTALEASSSKKLFSGSFKQWGDIRRRADPKSAADFITKTTAAQATVVENAELEFELYSGSLQSLASELKIDVGVFTAGMSASVAAELEVTLKFKQLKQEFLTDDPADLLSGFAPNPKQPDFPRKLYIVTGLWYLKQLELGAQRVIEAGTKEEAALTEAGAHVIQSATGLPITAVKANASVDAKSKKHVLLNMQGITAPIAAAAWKLKKYRWYELTKPSGFYTSPMAGRAAMGGWMGGDVQSSKGSRGFQEKGEWREEWKENGGWHEKWKATELVADLGYDSDDDN